jgi:phage head maturation protease
VLDGSMSFGFRSREDRWERRDGMLHRTLLDVDLVEISIVQEPAYKAPRSSLRGVDVDTSRRRLALRIRAAAGSAR